MLCFALGTDGVDACRGSPAVAQPPLSVCHTTSVNHTPSGGQPGPARVLCPDHLSHFTHLSDREMWLLAQPRPNLRHSNSHTHPLTTQQRQSRLYVQHKIHNALHSAPASHPTQAPHVNFATTHHTRSPPEGGMFGVLHAGGSRA
jgi:hypothetical protein